MHAHAGASAAGLQLGRLTTGTRVPATMPAACGRANAPGRGGKACRLTSSVPARDRRPRWASDARAGSRRSPSTGPGSKSPSSLSSSCPQSSMDRSARLGSCCSRFGRLPVEQPSTCRRATPCSRACGTAQSTSSTSPKKPPQICSVVSWELGGSSESSSSSPSIISMPPRRRVLPLKLHSVGPRQPLLGLAPSPCTPKEAGM